MASPTAGSAVPIPPARSSRPSGVLASVLGLADWVLCVAAAGHGRACVVLLLLSLACFLPGLASLQPMDRDEPRFAQASKQMIETGDLVDIRFQGEARHKKPVGIYWAQAATVAAAEGLGVERARSLIALYRLPSLFGALGASLLAYWAALAFLPRRGAVLAAALFTACLMLSAEARLAKTDALLTACAVAAMGALARAWLGRPRLERRRAPPSRATALVFWLALALGILVKGPMVPLFAGLAALALGLREGSWRWLLGLRPLPGLVLTLLVVAPWFAAIAWKSGGAFYGEAVGHDMLGKVGAGAEKHWAPPGSYLAVFFATFWPGAAFAALSLPFAWRHRREDAVAFLLAWIVPAWAIFEAVPTKLPHYVLPLMPAVAILTVMALAGAPALRRRWETGVAGLVVALPLGITLGLCAAAWGLDRTIPWAALPPLLAACAVAGLAWTAFSRGLGVGALAVSIAAGALLSAGLFGLAQRDLPALKLSPRLAAIRDRLPCEGVRTASLGYREPSLVFLIGTDLATPNTAEEAAAFLRAGGCRLVFVEGRFAEGFARAAAGLDAKPVGEVSGFNINTGRRTSLSAYAAGLPGASPP